MRGHNEGSIATYGDGRTVVRVTMADGSRRSKTLRGPDAEKRANAELRKLLRERDDGIVGADSSLGRFLLRWLDDVRPPKLAPETWRKYDSDCRLHLIPALGHLRISALTYRHLNDYYRAKADEGLGGQSIRHHRAALKVALRAAMRDGLVVRNAADLSDVPDMVKAERRVLDIDESKRLLAAAEGDRLYAAFVLVLHAGLRSAELRGLTWADVDLDAGALSVKLTTQRVWTGEVNERTGRKVNRWERRKVKTDKSRRLVPLTPLAVAALRAHRELQRKERGAYSFDGLVFTSVKGYPIHGSNLTPVLARLLAQAGLPHVTLHDLRHSCASILYERGIAIETIADLLGHSTTRITADLYRHRSKKLQREAADALQAAFAASAV